MPQTGLIFRVLVASPGDCAVERKIIPEVVAAWNAVHSTSTAAVVEPVMWETHSRPEMGDRPQGIINKQLLARCDLLVGAFWTRLGTPTGEAASGTAEEIEEFRQANKPVLLYFSSAPVVPESLDQGQYQALVEYREVLAKQGLYSRYESHAEFRAQLERHFASTMIELLQVSANAGGALVASAALGASAALAAAEPDPLAAQRASLRTFQQQLEVFLRKLKAEWAAERDSDPHSTDDGKYILSRACDEVVHFRSMITHDNSSLTTLLDSAARRLRAIQRHTVYIDGGVSFRKFWEEGDSILVALEAAPSIVQGIAEGGSSQVNSREDR